MPTYLVKWPFRWKGQVVQIGASVDMMGREAKWLRFSGFMTVEKVVPPWEKLPPVMTPVEKAA